MGQWRPRLNPRLVPLSAESGLVSLGPRVVSHSAPVSIHDHVRSKEPALNSKDSLIRQGGDLPGARDKRQLSLWEDQFLTTQLPARARVSAWEACWGQRSKQQGPRSLGGNDYAPDGKSEDGPFMLFMPTSSLQSRWGVMRREYSRKKPLPVTYPKAGACSRNSSEATAVKWSE